MVAIFVQTCSYFWLTTNTDLTPPLRRYNSDALGPWLHCLMGLLALQPCWPLVGCIQLTPLEPPSSSGVYERWLPSRNFGRVRGSPVTSGSWLNIFLNSWTSDGLTTHPSSSLSHTLQLTLWDVWLSTTEGLRANSSCYHKWEVILSFKTAVVNCWLSCHMLTSLIHTNIHTYIHTYIYHTHTPIAWIH